MSSLIGCAGPAVPLLLLSFGLLVPFRGIPAQEEPDSTLTTIRVELDSLIPLMRAGKKEADRAEWLMRKRAMDETQLPVDTFFAGPFRVISLPEQRILAEEVFTATWEELRPLVDGSEELLEAWTFLFHHYWSRDGMVLEGDTLLRRVSLPKRYPRSSLERSATQVVGNVLMRGMPQDLLDWSGGQPRVESRRLAWVARELVSTPSQAVRGCFHGDLDWCVEAVGLGPEGANWERWYTPAELRLYVRSMGSPLLDQLEVIWEQCVLAEADEACFEYLRDRDPVIPLSVEARASLLGHALWTGGPGALGRLRGAAREPLLDQLTAASGMPPDSLLASWRTSVLEARTSAWAGLVRSPLSFLLWIVFFGALAVRSTRWRLG
jgi:hypothetical protein